MTRRYRAAAQVAAAAISTPIAQIVDPSVGEAAEPQDDDLASLQSADDLQDHAMKDEDEEEEDDETGQVTPVNDSDVASQHSTPARGRPFVPLKRRAGRPPKTRGRPPVSRDDAESRDAGSDAGTPRRRGGWRGRGLGGGRWGKPRGGPSHITQVPLDKEGNMANVKDDEIELPEDSEGETKVNKNGVLLGDREYKVRVFTISGKGDRLYMLSTEPARCTGFRDSYLFFQKHKTLWKIILTEEAKRDLIERSLIPHSYKGRAIGVVTARSVFREFGAKIIIGGRKVVDDYQVAAARARGDVEGELAVPEDKLPVDGDTYDKNRFVAWHGASSVYHSGGPSMPLPNDTTTNQESPDRRVDSRFSPIPPILERNFVVADTYYVSPPSAGFGLPGPDGDALDIGPPGFTATAQSVTATLPPECLMSLDSVRREAINWKNSWQGEDQDGARAQLRISYNQ
ncbi:MAG: hypothetical protein Q9184_000548 [Pyrenodesmia sp. 2 TL-2023]